MMNGSRPYRLAASVLVPALVLLLGVGGVTLMQLCALGPMAATMQSERSGVPPCHGGMPDSGEESGHEVPGESTACCFAVVAVPAGHASAVAPAQSFAPVLALLAPFVSATAPTPAPRDTGPPPPPVRSHLALSVLLI